ncbi:PDZ domain-containing protein [Bacillus songklensis]|uniref:PDZ domain-containing protein n=1 Tax=Bacillus songklensis TaxID=1069116 RepID=A0ABV8BBU5_9BACI
MEIITEGLHGIGRFFLHPLTYFFIMVAFFVGQARVKRERKYFHTRVFDFVLESKYLFFPGILIGIVLSIITFIAGVYIPIGIIALLSLITVLLSGPFTFRWLSPAYVIGFTMVIAFLLPEGLAAEGPLKTWLTDIQEAPLSSLVALLALLLLAEGYLIWKVGGKGTSPAILKSKRGFPIGAHFSQKLWGVPVLLLIPGDGLVKLFSWWPTLSLQGEAFSLFLVPFGIGFFQKVQGMLPSESIENTGKRVLALGIAVMLSVPAAFFFPITAVFIASIAILIREFISIQQKLKDENAPFFFSKREKGLVILGVIPKSPAEKMEMKVGEVIVKVNGVAVSNVNEFYHALQLNRAYCKLEVNDVNGEVRFVQRALYDGEHHELGVLFVQSHQDREPEAV